MGKPTVLILDDEKRFTEELSEFLQNSGFHAIEANTAEIGLLKLKSEQIDLLILDIRLNGVSGLDILKDVKVKYPNLEVIVVSAHGDMDTVINAMRMGAIDYLRKPFRHIDVQIAIERSRKFLVLQNKISQLQENCSLISKYIEERINRQFIGVSKQINEVFELAMTASKYPDVNVLITGESGTGKENIARIIHYASKRKDHVLCAVNSSAITDSLSESEFFGHKKGSFTGAIIDKKGFFETSNKGTLFLDEIADMPMNLQAKILRAIEEKMITRVGETHQIATDFRIIAATNYDVEKLVEEKKFRLDLMYRLNTIHIHIPPLRERPDDIEPLLNFFVADFCNKLNKPILSIDNELINALMSYHFPGNVRELKNMTNRAIIFCNGNKLYEHNFQIKAGTAPKYNNNSSIQKLNLHENEAEMIRTALQKYNNNQTAVSKSLGIQRMALIRKMHKYGIQFPPKGHSENTV